MRIRRTAAALLLLTALSGCQTQGDIELTALPEGTRFTPVGEAAGFDARGELQIYPHHEMVGGGLASFRVHIRSMSDRELRNVRTAVFYPEEIVQVGHVFEPYLVSLRGYDLSPSQPSYGIGQTFSFPDWDQADVVLALAEQPIRLRLVWDGGQRFLEIPPEAISATQEDEPRRLPADSDLFNYPSHPALMDHLSYSEGRYLSRARGVTAAGLLDWYRAEMPAQGWKPVPGRDGALLFRQGDLFLSLSASDAPGGMTIMWSHLRAAAAVSAEQAIRIVRARYPEDLENQWTAGYAAGHGAPAPYWEVRGLRQGEVWVAAWVDALTAELLRVQEEGDERAGLFPDVPRHPGAVEVLSGSGGTAGMRTRGITAADIMGWYSAELPLRGWVASPIPLSDDRVLRFAKDGQFLGLSTDAGPGGLVVVWADLRSTPEVTEEQALAVAAGVHLPPVEWAAEYVADFESDWYGGATAPVWRVEGRRSDSDASVVVWVDALTALPRRVMEIEGR